MQTVDGAWVPLQPQVFAAARVGHPAAGAAVQKVRPDRGPAPRDRRRQIGHLARGQRWL